MKSSEKEKKRLESSHTEAAILERLSQEPKRSHLRDFIYGAIDGTVTTFAIIAGAQGAHFSPIVIIVLGTVNLLADGFSMGASNYLGTKAEKELFERAKKEEEHHIAHIPEGEKEEIRHIFAQKGFHGANLDKIVETITSDERLWVDTMLKEELRLSTIQWLPITAALTTLLAFLSIGLIPLLPYLFSSDPFLWSGFLAAVVFFTVGSFKSFLTKKRWLLSGLETLLIGGGAALLAYSIGLILKDLLS